MNCRYQSVVTFDDVVNLRMMTESQKVMMASWGSGASRYVNRTECEKQTANVRYDVVRPRRYG